jgi:hypothetical protein
VPVPVGGRGATVSEHSFGPGYTVSSLSYVVSLLPKSIVRTLRLERPRRDGQAGPNLVRQILWHRIRDRAEATTANRRARGTSGGAS